MSGLRQRLLWVLLCSALSLGLFAPAAGAGLVSTQDVVASTQADQARTRIKALVQRPELAKKLALLGVPPDQIQARVDAMTDSEVIAIAGKLDSLPAGGRLNDTELLLFLILIVLLAIAL